MSRYEPEAVTVGVGRRSFLKAFGAATIATAAGPAVVRAFGSTGSNALAAELFSEALPAHTPILVLVDLEGGNDCLNTLCPVTDPWYYDPTYGHGNLAIGAADARSLSGTGYKLHPSLVWLASRWATNKDVAFVLGLGENVVHQFSHFEAMNQWHSGSFDINETTGFLGRFHDLNPTSNPMAAISLNGVHPALVGSQTSVLSVESVQWFDFYTHWRADRVGEWQSALRALGTSGRSGTMGSAGSAIAGTLEAQAVIEATYDQTLDSSGQDWFWQQLSHAAMMIRGGVPCQTYVASLGGFDTHDNQAWPHSELLARLDAGLQSFFTALQGHARANDVVVMIYSEFGRKITQNGTGGTDHGQGGMAMLVGPRVHGGVYGEMPTLDPGGPSRPNRIEDSLEPNLDFRALLGAAVNFLADDDGAAAEVLEEGYGGVDALVPWKHDDAPVDPVSPPLDPGSGRPAPMPPATVSRRVGTQGGRPLESVAPRAGQRGAVIADEARTASLTDTGDVLGDLSRAIRGMRRGSRYHTFT